MISVVVSIGVTLGSIAMYGIGIGLAHVCFRRFTKMKNGDAWAVSAFWPLTGAFAFIGLPVSKWLLDKQECKQLEASSKIIIPNRAEIDSPEQYRHLGQLLREYEEKTKTPLMEQYRHLGQLFRG